MVWSNVANTTFTTEPPTLPVFSAIPAQISHSSQIERLDLTPYVTSQSALSNWRVTGNTNGVRIYQHGLLEVGPTADEVKDLQITVDNLAGTSDPVTVRWTVVTDLLSNPIHQNDLGDGTAEATVDSVAAIGTLYAAIRLDEPYPDTIDGGLEIIAGKDNVWMGDQATLEGKNTFNATGLNPADAARMHWGFVILVSGTVPT